MCCRMCSVVNLTIRRRDVSVVLMGPGKVSHLPDTIPPVPVSEGQVRIEPTWVGLCGSDFHLVSGQLVPPAGLGPVVPHRLGHEFTGRVRSVGQGVSTCKPGDRIAVWPITDSCGHCTGCRSGRPNACPLFRLTGVHVDGALGSHVDVNESQVVVLPDSMPALVGALCEPLSISLSAVERAAVSADDTVLITGGGPIGLAALIAARDIGARVVVSEPMAVRRDIALNLGAIAVADGTAESIGHALTAQSLPAFTKVIECTGLTACLSGLPGLLSPLATIVLVGLSGQPIDLPINVVARTELSILGSSVSSRDTFVRAVELAARKSDDLESLVSHRISQPEAPEVLMSPPQDDHIKILVKVENP